MFRIMALCRPVARVRASRRFATPRLCLEPLEDRTVPTIFVHDVPHFTFVTPRSVDVVLIDSAGQGRNHISGTSDGVPFEDVVFYNVPDVVIDTARNDSGGAGIDRVTVNTGGGGGAAGLRDFTIKTGQANDAVLVQMPFTLPVSGGRFEVQTGADADTLTINGPAASDNILLASNSVTINGDTVFHKSVEQLFVNALGGNDSAALTSIGAGTATTVDCGADFDRFAATLSHDFDGTLALLDFENITVQVHDSFKGDLSATGPGIIQSIFIGGNLSPQANISAEDIAFLTIDGNLAGAVTATGTIHSLTVGGSISQTGAVTAKDIDIANVIGNVRGTVTVHGSGTIGNMEVGGSVGETGTVFAEDITVIKVAGNVDGTVMAEGSGTIGTMEVGGSVGETGTVFAEDITTIKVAGNVNGTVMAEGSGNIEFMLVAGDVTGHVFVEETLASLTVLGKVTMRGLIEAGDIGRAFIDPSGQLLGTTTVRFVGGMAGRLIARGNLVGQVFAAQGISGVVATQGDVGVIQRNRNGGAFVGPNGQLIRAGGIFTQGLSGQVVALGNTFGDIVIQGDLTGRMAVKGRPVLGLLPFRVGILGNLIINGAATSKSAIVSGGVIGDQAGGTFLKAGAFEGIVAAKGDINFASGTVPGGFIFENAAGTLNGAVIDAIFTDEGKPLAFDFQNFDLRGLDLILKDLALLRVGPNGNLTGPRP